MKNWPYLVRLIMIVASFVSLMFLLFCQNKKPTEKPVHHSPKIGSANPAAREPIKTLSLQAPPIPLIVPKIFRHLGQWSGKIEHYTPQTLYTLINGGDQLYLAYDFVHLTYARYQQAKTGLDLFCYQMGSSENALGIYHSEKAVKGRPANIGRMSYLTHTSLFFIQGNFYVKILITPEKAGFGDSLIRLGQIIEAQIKPGLSFSEMERRFPAADREPDSLGYLNRAAFNLSNLQKIFTMNYTRPGQSAVLFFSPEKGGQATLEKCGQEFKGGSLKKFRLHSVEVTYFSAFGEHYYFWVQQGHLAGSYSNQSPQFARTCLTRFIEFLSHERESDNQKK